MATEENKKANTPRPPVVAILGHIDHGKSTLLDYIRSSNIVSGEAGGITQHISAYEIEHDDKEHGKRKITFIDTPGHEAFCDVRSRGAQVADIGILIVSAEDGVMPQTKEALKCIKEDGVPFIVAITKIDSPKSDVDKAKTSLIENEVYIEGFGGDIPVVAVSGKTGEGVDDLLSMIVLVSELEEFKMDTESLAEGIVVEANKDQKRGISATLIVKNGKLEIGNFVAGHTAMSPVRSIEDTNGNKLESAQASTPIVISGWNELPPVGSTLKSFTNKKDAEKYCTECKTSESSSDNTKENKTANGENEVVVPVIIKTDVSGTGEAIAYEINKIENDRVSFNILNNSTGNISESDMKLAAGNENTVVVGMGVSIDSQAEALKERDEITVATFKIIYELIEFLEKLAQERRPKVMVEKVNGVAKILAVFNKTKKSQVVGGKVKDGIISIGNEVRILRRNEEIGRGTIKELQQQKIKTEKVDGGEFGTAIQTDVDIAESDHIEAIEKVES